MDEHLDIDVTDPAEATSLMEDLPESLEKLQKARDDIAQGRTFALEELPHRGSNRSPRRGDE